MRVKGKSRIGVDKMKEKIICTILILLLQLIQIICSHEKYGNKKFDIFHILYQISIFIIFQILIWKVV